MTSTRNLSVNIILLILHCVIQYIFPFILLGLLFNVLVLDTEIHFELKIPRLFDVDMFQDPTVEIFVLIVQIMMRILAFKDQI